MLKGLRIEALAAGGAGVAHAEDGRVVFVTGACPGDVLDAEQTADHGRFVEARTAEIVEPSAQRRVPPCPYFGVCGGCQWQHVAYEVQIASKRRLVADALQRIGRIEDIELDETVAGNAPYSYRNRLEMRVGSDDSKRPFLGLTRAETEEVVRIDKCLLLPERARTLPKALSGAIRYLEGRAPLGIERVGLRTSTRTGDLEVDLWSAPGPAPRQAIARTLRDASRADVVTRVLVKGDARRRHDAKVEVLAGRGHWRERLAGHTFRVSAPSFFQVNTDVAERMSQRVLDLLQPDGTDRVLDLYAGVGLFTLPLAEAAGEVTAVEGNGAALRDLRANLEAADLEADVLGGDAARALEDAGSFDAAVVDPPRTGMTREALAGVAATGIRRLAYVSCDPATLARDAAALGELGLRPIRATPMDMFPQTWHVETVALFERRSV